MEVLSSTACVNGSIEFLITGFLHDIVLMVRFLFFWGFYLRKKETSFEWFKFEPEDGSSWKTTYMYKRLSASKWILM